jgi:ubiquitin-protein ligase
MTTSTVPDRSTRLRLEYESLQTLKQCLGDESPFTFQYNGELAFEITFSCNSIIDMHGKPIPHKNHKVKILISDDYPTTPPDLFWQRPIIYHPNVHQQGYVCLLSGIWRYDMTLAEICYDLWDLARYAICTEESPYNVPGIKKYIKDHQDEFPLDPRSLRVLVQQAMVKTLRQL